MANEKQTTSGGVGFTGLLQITFIVLKLIGKIDWTWWWVLSPTWISFALLFFIAACVLIYYALTGKY